jgi:hypothetical protein
MAKPVRQVEGKVETDRSAENEQPCAVEGDGSSPSGESGESKLRVVCEQTQQTVEGDKGIG